MFKIESYLTPYISAYLAKYVKDFSTPNFQVSFWQGDAVFHDVNLNLEALENELRLPPLTFVSGHIHELRLSVPWTKITSEPIRVYINTFEIVLKLRGDQAEYAPPKCPPTSNASNLDKMKSTPEEEGYMKNLAKKVLQNVEIVFENVVLKYVEDDIVLSLNIRKVVSQCVNNKWEPAFTELTPPAFLLRKLWTCSDLTICLDKTNNVGKIEQYMDPILYRCSFQVRVLHQYHGMHAQIPFFGRYDIKVTSMNFSVITEQIPILARLYYLLKLLAYVDTGRRSSRAASARAADEQIPVEVEAEQDHSVLGWASWAISWVPAIPEVIFGPSDESLEPLPECEFTVPVIHYGIFVENATIDFKLLERGSEKALYRKPPRVKYTPFLKCELQGIAVDCIFRGFDANFKMGVSEVLANGCGFCPCGVDDSGCVENVSCSIDLFPFLRIGKPNSEFASGSMFDPRFELMGDVRPPVDYHFKQEGHLEEYSDEEMLKRTPGIALEFLELEPTRTRSNETEDNYYAPLPPVATHCSLCRLVMGVTQVKVCSGSIHRARLMLYYLSQVDKTIYAFLHDIVFPKTNVFNEAMSTLDGRTLFTFKFSVRDPLIEVIAADHPDYDYLSHIRAFNQRRRCTNTRPLILCSNKWPELTLRCDQINGQYTEPTIKFTRLVESYSGSFTEHGDVVSDYAAKLKISVDNMTARLMCGEVDASLIEPCTFSFNYENHRKPSILISETESVQQFKVHVDSFQLQMSKPNLMTSHVILRSICEETLSLALLHTTLMDDLPIYSKNGDFVLNLTGLTYLYNRTNTVISHRAFLKTATASAVLPEFAEAVQLLSVPESNAFTDNKVPRKLVEFLLQYPLNVWDEKMIEGWPTLLRTPIFAVYIGACTVNLYLLSARWLTYTPKPAPSPPTSLPEIILTCQRLQPISPLGKDPYETISARSAADDFDSQSSTSKGSQSLTGVRELYRRHASTHKTEISSNMSFKSAPEDHNEQSSETFLDPWQSLIENQKAPQAPAFPWEHWIVMNLDVIKKAFIKVEVEGAKFCFPVESPKLTNVPQVPEYFVIETPSIIAQPDSLSTVNAFNKSSFQITKPIHVKGGRLYPLKVVLTNIHGYSLHGPAPAEKLTFLPSLSVRLALTLSDKLVENKYPTIFACVHCDIPPVKIVLSTFQAKLLMQIMESVMDTVGIVRRASDSSFLLSVDPSWENLTTSEVSKRASVGFCEPRKLAESYLKGSQSSMSVFESIPPSVSIGTGTEGSVKKLDTPTKKSEKKKKATFWAQVTLSNFQLILRNGETPLASDVTNQLVLEIEDVVSALDIQPVYVKLTLKVGSLSLRCYERNEEGNWDFGKHNGVIFSSGDELTHDIDILGFAETGEDNKEDHNSSTQPSTSVAKKHGFLNLTFTRVLARNYHRKSEVTSPTAKWNALLRKYFSIFCDEKEDRRTLDELDVKIRPFDLMVSFDVLLPFRTMIHNILCTESLRNVAKPLGEGSRGHKIPSLNNNTLPMIYLETEMIRVFVQCKKQDDMSAGTHDIVLLQMASLNLASQTDNPLARVPVKRDLYVLAEKASILSIPGSPVEDRQYQLDLRDLSIVTCNSNDLENSSRKEFSHRSKVFLRAMGENPAFEWNIKEEQMQEIEDVEAYILLERIQASAVFAPPIVYQASAKSVFESMLISGQVFEMNIPSTISIGCSTEQVSCLLAISNDCNDFWDTYKEGPESDIVDLSTCPSSHVAHPLESGTFIQTLLTPKSLQSSSTDLDSGIASTRKPEYRGSRESSPFDVIITCSGIEVKFYEYQRKERVPEVPAKLNTKNYRVRPLLYLSLSQPHLIGHVSTLRQNLEITSYGFSVGMGIASSYTSDSFRIPQMEDYSLKFLRSIEGKKNPKTGMANAYFTLRLTDFFHSTCNASLELFRPIRLLIDHEVLAMVQKTTNIIHKITQLKGGTAKNNPLGTAPKYPPRKHVFSGISAFQFNSDQVVVTFRAARNKKMPEAELTCAVSSTKLTVSSKTKRAFGLFPFYANVLGSITGFMINCKFQQRTDVVLNPWNSRIESNVQLVSWSGIPKGSILIRAEPVSVFFGPQNILAALQICHELETFFVKKEGKSDPLTEQTSDMDVPSLNKTFYDDLRAGMFKYVVSETAALPGVYQISFSHSQQTMTWRYPQPRYLSEVQVLPVPIIAPSSRKQEYNSVECSLMYWVEALSEFKELVVFTLSETSGMKVNLPKMEDAHDYVSDIWRVNIITYHEEDESELDTVRPEILASCLQVNSVYNPSLVQDLKLNFDMPKVTIHLVNHHELTGHMSEDKLARFSYSTPVRQDQVFATIELSSTFVNWHQWLDKAKLSIVSYFQFSVVEYSFLTNVSLIEPFHFQFKAGLSSECLSDIDFLAKPIVLKIGGSSLHTIMSSFAIWKQCLSAYSGRQVNLSELTNTCVAILPQTVMCNDTASTFNVLQDGTDTYINLLMRQCYGYHFTTPKAAPRCRIRLQGESCWSKPFGMNKNGYIVLDAGNNLPAFVNISSLSASQKMVTISGGLTIANALNESIDVSIVSTLRDGKEINYSIAGRSHGPSHILDTNEVRCFQFKLTTMDHNDCSEWTTGVRMEDMRKSVNRSVAIDLVSAEAWSLPALNYNVWCSLVEEKVDSFHRYLVVICPFFRVKSSLAGPTLTFVSTGKNEIESSSPLQGKGSEIQVNFVGPSDSTLHLTFQHGMVARNSHSRPTIPLNPHGPALEKGIQHRPIDEILERVVLRKDCDKIWPFIREDIPLTVWEQVESQPETEVQVEFSPWIQGLPSVLIDAKPWALFVNMTGKDILFCDNNTDGEIFTIPNVFVFTPSKIREYFRLGIDYEQNSFWTPNLEFTEQKSRTDIHYVNSDNRIPIDCYSRLELSGMAETWHITLETRIHKGILILAMRPTYSMQNRIDISLNVKCLALLSTQVASENDLNLRQDMVTLDVDLNDSNNETMEPLMMFSKDAELPYDETRVKYLAIGCENAPFWFVQLPNFELIFNNMSATEVIPGHRMALALQSCQPFRCKGSAGEPLKVTYPVILSWVCKYGQVWISISKDKAPPIVLLNETNGAFVVAESNGRTGLPYLDNHHFMQYLTLSPLSIGHCSLPSVNMKFPDVNKSEAEMSIMLGKHRDMLPGTIQLTSIYYESSQLEWSTEIQLNKITGTHSFRIGDYNRAEHYQLRVERLGLSYFVYVRNISTSEISAKDIRGRIADASTSYSNILTNLSAALLTRRSSVSRLDLSGARGLQLEPSPDFQPVLSADIDAKISTLPPFPMIRAYLPLLRLIVTDDYTYLRERKEMLALTFQDLWVDVTPETDPNLLEILQNKPQENMAINIRLGDLQIDNALHEEKKFDFPVIMKSVQDYKPLSMKTVMSLETIDALFQTIAREKNFLVEFTGLVGLCSPTERSLQKVWLEFQPTSLYMEDAFYFFLQPAFNDMLSIVYDRLHGLHLVRRTPTGIEESSVPESPQLSETFIMVRDTVSTSTQTSEADLMSVDQPTASNVTEVAIYEEALKILQSVSIDRHEITQPKLFPTPARFQVPSEILSIINEFSDPIRMQQIMINPAVVFMTVRLSKRLYLAVDHSPLEFSMFEARSILTTNLALGHALSSHYVQGALFGVTNPMKLLGSLELLGSPGSLARSVGIGIKDFVVYPVKGLFEGPAGFVTGFTHGCTSLLTNVGSGTLTSVRNLAWSVSRNLDRMTLSENEQLQHEEDRRATIDGVSDGIIHGLTGFGIRLLGAIGGLAQHPIESVIDSGGSPMGLLAGFGRGLLGVITKPIGGAVELVAMTGQGILTGAGWTPKLQRKHIRINETVDSAHNSMLKYYWMLQNETPDEEHKILLICDASLCSTPSESTPVSILLTNEDIYIIDVSHDEIENKVQISRIMLEPTNDTTKLSLRQAPEKKPESISLAQERLLDFVKGCAIEGVANEVDTLPPPSPPPPVDNEQLPDPPEKTEETFSLDLFVDPNTKSEFITLFKQVQEQKKGTVFPLL